MVHSSTNKLVVLDGLDNYIIVDQKDVLLICKKENEQLIKQYMHDAKSQKGEEYI
jgi:mannose-1-phosphate guanylyltransferase